VQVFPASAVFALSLKPTGFELSSYGRGDTHRQWTSIVDLSRVGDFMNILRFTDFID